MQKIGDSTTTANASGEFTSGNPGAGVDATLITAEWLNAIQRELVAVIAGAGITLDPVQDDQVLQAMRKLAQAGAVNYALDAGSANVYTASYLPALTAFADGMAMRFKAKTTNTGASTFSPNGLPPKPIVGLSHAALQGGEIAADGMCTVIWSTALDKWILAVSSGGGAEASKLDAEAGTNNTKWMSPLRVFQAIAKVVTQSTETAFGWSKIATEVQVTAGGDDTTIVTPKKLRVAQATQAEAETGTDNTKIMTPLRAVQAIRSAAAAATELLRGALRIGTLAEVNAGSLDNVAVTPAKIRSGFTYSLSVNGYIIFPSWLLGITFMWGATQTNASGVGTTTFPLAFPTVCWHVLGTGRTTTPALMGVLGGSGAPTRTSYTWYASSMNGSPGLLGIDWIAIGR